MYYMIELSECMYVLYRYIILQFYVVTVLVLTLVVCSSTPHQCAYTIKIHIKCSVAS